MITDESGTPHTLRKYPENMDVMVYVIGDYNPEIGRKMIFFSKDKIDEILDREFNRGKLKMGSRDGVSVKNTGSGVRVFPTEEPGVAMRDLPLGAPEIIDNRKAVDIFCDYLRSKGWTATARHDTEFQIKCGDIEASKDGQTYNVEIKTRTKKWEENPAIFLQIGETNPERLTY